MLWSTVRRGAGVRNLIRCLARHIRHVRTGHLSCSTFTARACRGGPSNGGRSAGGQAEFLARLDGGVAAQTVQVEDALDDETRVGARFGVGGYVPESVAGSDDDGSRG